VRRELIVAAAAAAVAVGGATVASAATVYQGKMTSLKGVAIGPATSWVNALSKRGDAAGAYDAASGETRGFVSQAGKFTDLGVLNGGDYTDAMSVNDSGVVVGSSGDFSTSVGVHAFVWRSGKMTELPDLGGASNALVINGKGEIAGYALTSSGKSYAVTWQNGKITELPGLGGSSDDVIAMNESGQVAGYATTASGGQEAVLWTNGKATDLGQGEVIALTDSGKVLVEITPNSAPSYFYVYDHGKKTLLPSNAYPQTLNDEGQVVGVYIKSGSTAQDGFVWQDGKLTDLGAWQAWDINDRGQIVAFQYDNGVYESAVLDHGGTITLETADGKPVVATRISNGGYVTGASQSNETAMEWKLPNG
jgi:probable HAF family extracellular repeat protein